MLKLYLFTYLKQELLFYASELGICGLYELIKIMQLNHNNLGHTDPCFSIKEQIKFRGYIKHVNSTDKNWHEYKI